MGPRGSELSHPRTGSQEDGPLMVDLMCGPMPLAKAFLFCGWRALPIDWSLDPGHDLSNPLRQQALEAPMRSAAFTAAALDCSTKSRAREPLRTAAQAKPLRSEVHPEGLPGLDPKNQRRVDVENAACSWILKQLQAIADDGRGALQENPARSLHWSLPQEETMMESGLWYDTTYSACVFIQRLRHNIHEIELIHPRECHHQHAAWEWDPWEDTQGRHQFPSKEEAEYSATLAFAIAVSVSWWAVREGYARLHVPRMPPLEACGTVGITVRAGAHLYDGRLAATLRGFCPRQFAGRCRANGWHVIAARTVSARQMRWLGWSLMRPIRMPRLACPESLGGGIGRPGALCSGQMGSLRGSDALQSMSLWFPQEDVILAFRKLYPAEWFQSFQWPMLEDLLNQEPFTCYLDWRQSRGMGWDALLVQR